ncbi:MAG: hypothetical protein Q9211_003181 [Gyalolechia sp. 1 TL-2023]
MGNWFCETFCCFLIRFQNRLRSQNQQDAVGDRLECGQPVLSPPVFHHGYQGETSAPSRPIPLAPVYPGGDPRSAKRKTRPPSRTIPRSVPLPVRYPRSQTPTGKHFRHNRPAPNRMKTLPPLRISVDDRGIETTEPLATDKPPLNSSYATFPTQAPAYSSAVSWRQQPMSPASTLIHCGFPTLDGGPVKPYHVERRRDRPREVAGDHHRQQRHPQGMWADIGGPTSHGRGAAERTVGRLLPAGGREGDAKPEIR